MSAADHLHPTLFPAGQYRTGDPWAKSPERWMAGEHGPIAWHTTEQRELPRRDRGEGSFDLKADYGSGIGMHFGTPAAGLERAGGGVDISLVHSHPVRIPPESIEHPPTSLSAAHFDEQEGSTREDLWSDRAVNRVREATKRVRAGAALPYENVYEDRGSVSYRALPETVRTWSEDVHADPVAHPALKHLATQGYDPVQSTDDYSNIGEVHHQPELGHSAEQIDRDYRRVISTKMSEREDRILAGQQWKLAKP